MTFRGLYASNPCRSSTLLNRSFVTLEPELWACLNIFRSCRTIGLRESPHNRVRYALARRYHRSRHVGLHLQHHAAELFHGQNAILVDVASNEQRFHHGAVASTAFHVGLNDEVQENFLSPTEATS